MHTTFCVYNYPKSNSIFFQQILMEIACWKFAVNSLTVISSNNLLNITWASKHNNLFAVDATLETATEQKCKEYLKFSTNLFFWEILRKVFTSHCRLQFLRFLSLEVKLEVAMKPSEHNGALALDRSVERDWSISDLFYYHYF